MPRSRAFLIAAAALLLVVLLLAVWLATKANIGGGDVAMPPPASAALPPPTAQDLEQGARTAGTTERDALPASSASTPAPKPKAQKPPAARAPEKPDLDAKSPLELLVVDERSQPVFDAEITLRGMRSDTDSGSWYGYRGDPPTARTNAEGRARIDAWDWVNVDGRTRAVDLSVSHPDHPPFRDSDFDLGPGEHRVQLAPGTRVLVHAWTGSPARAVDAISIQMERTSGLPPGAWRKEGTDWVTQQLAPGLHSIQVSSPTSSPRLYSEFLDFTVVAGETKDLPIELHPAETLEGRLGEEVPRPVVDGHVLLAVRRAEFTAEFETISRTFEAAVADDGTFSIPNVPRGRGYLFALARGWCSPLVKAGSAREAGTRFSKKPSPEEEARALERMGDRVWVLPHTMLPQAERPLVVSMVQTGIIEIVVRDERGALVTDLEAGVDPNISIPDVGSMLVPWRTWYVPTDGQGLARIADIPPENGLLVGAGSEQWRLRARDRESHPQVNLKSGETVRIELVVEPNDPTKK